MICAESEDKMKVSICGIPHKVVECEDKFDMDCHFGMIDYKACEIRINKDMSEEKKKKLYVMKWYMVYLLVLDITIIQMMNS